MLGAASPAENLSGSFSLPPHLDERLCPLLEKGVLCKVLEDESPQQATLFELPPEESFLLTSPPSFEAVSFLSVQKSLANGVPSCSFENVDQATTKAPVPMAQEEIIPSDTTEVAPSTSHGNTLASPVVNLEVSELPWRTPSQASASDFVNAQFSFPSTMGSTRRKLFSSSRSELPLGSPLWVQEFQKSTLSSPNGLLSSSLTSGDPSYRRQSSQLAPGELEASECCPLPQNNGSTEERPSEQRSMDLSLSAYVRGNPGAPEDPADEEICAIVPPSPGHPSPGGCPAGSFCSGSPALLWSEQHPTSFVANPAESSAITSIPAEKSHVPDMNTVSALTVESMHSVLAADTTLSMSSMVFSPITAQSWKLQPGEAALEEPIQDTHHSVVPQPPATHPPADALHHLCGASAPFRLSPLEVSQTTSSVHTLYPELRLSRSTYDEGDGEFQRRAQLLAMQALLTQINRAALQAQKSLRAFANPGGVSSLSCGGLPMRTAAEDEQEIRQLELAIASVEAQLQSSAAVPARRSPAGPAKRTALRPACVNVLHALQAAKTTRVETRAGIQKTLMRTLPEVLEAAAAGSLERYLCYSRSAQESELEKLRVLYNAEAKDRARLHNMLQEMRGDIRVVVRVRPLLPSDAAHPSRGGANPGLEWEEALPGFLPSFPSATQVRLMSRKGSRARLASGAKAHQFEFDRVFDHTAKHGDIMEMLLPLVTSVMDGFNCCVLAYGQTGSGKTHTLLGTEEEPGVIFSLLHALWARTQAHQAQGTAEYALSLALMEIYNDAVYDLLRPTSPGGEGGGVRSHKLELRQSPSGEVTVPEL
eukprot:RCo033364